jgi:hypothetical protein
MEMSGTIFVIPEITLYELRRELFRIYASAKLQRFSSASRSDSNTGRLGLDPAIHQKSWVETQPTMS